MAFETVRNLPQTQLNNSSFFRSKPLLAYQSKCILARDGLAPEFAARALHDQPARRDVPKMDAELFDVRIE